MNQIREYLVREAERITAASVRDLPATAEEWYAQRPARWQRYMEMMGILDLEALEDRPPLNVQVTGVLQREGYRVEKLCFEALPRVYITANLYIPEPLEGRAPGVVYVCGHSLAQKVHYQPYPRRFAQLGFVTIILDTIEYQELYGSHHGHYSHGQFQWFSRGYTPAGVEMWAAMRAVDLLQERPDVNPDAIGVSGISGGGGVSYWLGAADERVKIVAPVCGTGTLASHLADRTWDGHCECMFPQNTYLWDLADVGALIAPRPLIIGAANRDAIYRIEAVRETYGKLADVYRLLGAEDKLALVETPGPHSYHVTSRQAIFSWFLRYLMGREVPPEEIEDVDLRPEAQEPAENLLVFPDGRLPRDERTTVVQDLFVPKADAPTVSSAEELASVRERTVSLLREKTFRHFPEPPADLQAKVVFQWETPQERATRLEFTPEEGWRLRAELTVSKQRAEGPGPCLVHLVSPRTAADGVIRPLAQRLPTGMGDMDPAWARLAVATRGVDETSWGDDLAWHVRRCSGLIGRTLASMRVLDALRALEMARELPEVDGARIYLSGSGEMAAVAVYAALLDGQVAGVVLSDPPATQDVAGRPDGSGPALEMLNVLQITDLPYAAGLLWPAELVFLVPAEAERSAAVRPESYRWAEDLYARLGEPGWVRRIQTLAALVPGG
jgi:cephalosporin-C deacetylase-like acetyl esterase